MSATRSTAGEALLDARMVSRSFGGLRAVDEVSVTLERGSLHAVIGTNGAGKSTLINLLSGELGVSSGSVELRGQDVTRWTQPRRARAGLGRSYQRNTIFTAFTVFENCRLSAQAHLRGFYGSLGFEAVSDEYLEDDIPHIEMLRRAG